MTNRRNGSNQNWEDYEDMSGKGVRRERIKAKRHKNKSDLNRCRNNTEDWDDFMENFEQTEKMNKDLS